MSDIDIDTAVDVAELRDKGDSSKKDEGVIALSTGVKLEVKAVPPMTILGVLNRFQAPKVPLSKSEETGREMENPDDPDYQQALVEWKVQGTDATMNVLILYGTKLKSVPDGFSTPDNDDWIDKLEIVGTETRPDSKNWRYLAWVKSEAAPNGEDMQLIMTEVGRLSGVAESDVKNAVNSFPGEQG